MQIHNVCMKFYTGFFSYSSLTLHISSEQNLSNTSLTRISLSELEDSGVYLFIYFDMVLLTFCEYVLTHSSASFHRDWKVFSGIVLILLSISNLKKAELLSETMQRAAKCCWKTGINGYNLIYFSQS